MFFFTSTNKRMSYCLISVRKLYRFYLERLFNLDDFPLVNREIEINCELEKVNTWLKLNKLVINVDKKACSFINSDLLLHYNFR